MLRKKEELLSTNNGELIPKDIIYLQHTFIKRPVKKNKVEVIVRRRRNSPEALQKKPQDPRHTPWPREDRQGRERVRELGGGVQVWGRATVRPSPDVRC
jgi:hypothetical protein